MSLEQLLERVEAVDVSKPNSREWRQIEIDICERFSARGFGSMPCEDYAASYLSDLNAVVRLVEEKLPDCWWRMEREQYYDNGAIRHRYIGRVHKQGWPRLHIVVSFATPALALCAALLRAMIAEGKS